VAGGNADDGGVLQLFGPSFPSNANVVALIAGPRATAKIWRFDPSGTLTAGGPITAPGMIRSDTGRLIAMNSGALPSVAAWDPSLNVASGFWVGSGGVITFGATDGGGVPVTGWATLTSTSLNVPGLGSVGTISSNNNIVAAGNLYARSGNVFFGPGDTAVLNSDGTNATLRFRSDNWNLAWNGSNGTLSFNKPGVTLFTVDANGTGAFAAGLNVNNGALAVSGAITSGGNITGATLTASGLLQAASGGMSLGAGGSGRYMQFSPSWYWDWNSSNGDLNWQTASGQMAMFRQADKIIFATQGPCAGIGVYQNLSDIRTKTDITQAPYGLAEVLRINPILFRRVNGRGVLEIGFSAQELREIIPETVMKLGLELPDGSGGLDDADPTLGMGIDGVVAALVNANKELAARVAALEAR